MPGAAEVIAAQERVLAQERAQTAPVAPQVPGLSQHAAAEAQVNIVYYFILWFKGLKPVLRVPLWLWMGKVFLVKTIFNDSSLKDDFWHVLYKCILQVLAAQAQVGTAFTGIVGASGNIGPSGLCGPSGCVAF